MKISFWLLIRVLLPFHKRSTDRLKWLTLFSNPADSQMSYLTQLYNSTIATLNVTGQTLALQEHLSRLLSTPVTILHFEQSTMEIGMEIEDGALSYTLIGLHMPLPDYSDPMYDLPPDPGEGWYWPGEEPPPIEDDPFTGDLSYPDADELHVLISLFGESESSLIADYKIIVPQGTDLSILNYELEKYRPAGKTFNIELS